MEEPLVSVIIPVYNGEQYLSKTLGTVMMQTYPNWEIIAINNGSSDDTKNILKWCEQDYPEKIRVITLEENVGISNARNLGVKEAHGKYIAFLDADDIWRSDKLEKQVKQFQQSPNLGLSFTNESIIDSSGEVVVWKALTLTKEMRGANTFEKFLFEPYIPVSAIMMERTTFWCIGGFDPKWDLVEDYEFLLRAVRIATVDYIDEQLISYRDHKGSWTYKRVGDITRECNECFDLWVIKGGVSITKNLGRYLKFKVRIAYLKFKTKVGTRWN